MTELELSKFIENRGCEWHWDYHEDGMHLVLFVSAENLREFCNMLGVYIFDDEGLPCEQRLLHDGSVGLAPFEDICEYYGIETETIFPKKKENQNREEIPKNMKKLIDKDPFSNGMEHMSFESNNCDLCIKSSEPRDGGKRFTNADKDNMPKCSIQRDIVTRCICSNPIKQETIDICNNYVMHGTLCPYMQTQRKHRQKQAKNQQSLEI